MKNYMLLTALLLVTSYSAFSQDSLRLKKMTLKVKVNNMDGSSNHGYLQQVSDSVVTISPHSVRYGALSDQYEAAQHVPYYNINSVIVKKRNRIAKGALIGTLSGIAVGIAIELTTKADPYVPVMSDAFGKEASSILSTGEKTTYVGVVGGIIGAGVGALVGSLIQKTFFIAGNKNNYKKMRENVLDMTYRKP